MCSGDRWRDGQSSGGEARQNICLREAAGLYIQQLGMTSVENPPLKMSSGGTCASLKRLQSMRKRNSPGWSGLGSTSGMLGISVTITTGSPSREPGVCREKQGRLLSWSPLTCLFAFVPHIALSSDLWPEKPLRCPQSPLAPSP